MPTFKISVLKHQQRRDGKFPVSIRITQNRQSVYLKTDTYVIRKQISAGLLFYIKEINVKSLQGFIEYMGKPRTITRTDQRGAAQLGRYANDKSKPRPAACHKIVEALRRFATPLCAITL